MIVVFIPEEIRQNRVYSHTALQFEPLYPGRMESLYDPRELPPAVTILENGDALLRFYAPAAQEVCAGLMDQPLFPLTKGENGVWEGTLPFPGFGMVTIDWRVDGVQVLNPFAPVYYSYSRPVNFIDVPDPDMDYILVKDVPHGSTINEYYYSKVMGNFERLMVYTPPGYEKSTQTYPVLYLQHGAFEDDVSWVFNGKINFIMDNLIAEGIIDPFVIVMCNGSVGHTEFHKELPSTLFVQMLLEDAMPFVEEKYRIRKDADGRAIAGLSMGSKQTCQAGFGHPGLFSYIGIFSGSIFGMRAIDPNPFYLENLQSEKMLKENYKLVFRSMGDEDPFWDAFEEDDRELEKRNASPDVWPAHVRKVYPGKHLWNTWRLTMRDFLPLLFR